MGDRRQLLLIDVNLALCRFQFLEQKFDQGRFTRTALTHDKNELPLLNVNIDIIERRHTLLVCLTNVF